MPSPPAPAAARPEPGDRAAALAHWSEAVKAHPRSVPARIGLGSALGALSLYKFAVLNFDRALALEPGNAQAYVLRGHAFNHLQAYEQAMADFDRAIELAPHEAQAHNHRANVLGKLGRLDLALQAFDRAIALAPDYAEPHYGKAIVLLSKCEFQAGWREYQWRWRVAGWDSTPLATAKPLWRGQKTSGRLLVWSEQGVGEQILFGSLLPHLAQRRGGTAVSVDRRLVPLLSRSLPGFDFIADEEPLADEGFDEHVPIADLPALFRPRASDYRESPRGYLRCDPLARQALAARIRTPGKLCCGLSWFGRNPLAGDFKSLTLEQLLPLLRADGVDFVDLQYGDTRRERAALEAAHGVAIRKLEDIDSFKDLDGLAALIGACDVVVTSSSTTAHLAGALGKETLLLTTFGIDTVWCWPQADGASLWYPSVRVFRQHAPGDWSGAVGDARRHLEAMR
jgi:hypothetical protein